MAVEEEPEAGIPEWVVTFGDMMSLLLTFFIMLVSLSETKKDEQYQALSESIRKRFGHDMSMAALVPGNSTPRDGALAQVATMGRAKRYDKFRGGDKTPAPVGDHPRVRLIRPGSKTVVGTVVTFAEGSAELTAQIQKDLAFQSEEMLGKPQKIEIRGHTSQRPVVNDKEYEDNFDLAYRRCRETMEFLVTLGMDRRRIRMAVAGPNEPFHIGTDPLKLKQNPRVEVFLLDEVINDLIGNDEERDKRFVSGATDTAGDETTNGEHESVNEGDSGIDGEIGGEVDSDLENVEDDGDVLRAFDNDPGEE